jgi:predicted nucleic acid-binding protein
VVELAELLREGRASIVGLIRQELLAGIRSPEQFEALRMHLRAFPDLELVTEDHEEAAAFFNRCRTRGIQGSTIDFLICAAASRRAMPILTTDAEFTRYSQFLPVELHVPR